MKRAIQWQKTRRGGRQRRDSLCLEAASLQIESRLPEATRLREGAKHRDGPERRGWLYAQAMSIQHPSSY